MRDDLHKTVPLPPAWRRILKYLSNEKWSPAQLAPLIEWTVRNELTSSGDSDLRALQETLNSGKADLFGDGSDQMHLALLRIQDDAISVSARSSCEVALGVLATHGLSNSFSKQVMQATGLQHARDQVEHVVARVALQYGHNEAIQVQRQMGLALSKCDFTAAVAPPTKRARKSTDQLLSTELEVSF